MVSDFMGKLALFFIKLGVYSYWLQPRKIQLFWGNRLGGVLYRVGFRRKVVRENLSRAFPHEDQHQRRVLRAFYSHLGNLFLELLLVMGPLKKVIERDCEVHGVEHVEAALKQGKGLIFLCSHLGNWEVMAGAFGLKTAADFLMITKRLKPEWLHQAIQNGRKKVGASATYEPKTFRDVFSHLKKNGAVGVVLDQYAGPPVGVRVPVFGIPVGTPAMVATLVKRTGAPVLPVVNYRLPDGRWRVEIGAPIPWKNSSDPRTEIAINTAEYSAEIEKQILAHPEQWLWTHRRFKGDLSPLRENEWAEGRART